MKNIILIDPTEDQIQIAVSTWLDSRKNILWCHVANERRTSVKNGSILKRKGVKKGVPDILIFTPPPLLDRVGVAIEIKRNNKCKATKDQNLWLKKLSENNWIGAVCYGYDDTIETLISMGY